MSFALYTVSKGKANKQITIGAKLWQVEHLKDLGRTYSLTLSDINLINPNTQNLPIFHNDKDVILIKKIFISVPVLSIENTTTKNSWNISFLRMIDMTIDSGHFKTYPELDKLGYILNGAIFKNNSNVFHPVYESKFISAYNHRASTFEGIPEDKKYIKKAATKNASIENLKSKNWTILPRYWVPEKIVSDFTPVKWQFKWFIGFRNAINAVADARSTIFSVIPKYGAGNSFPLIITDLDAKTNMLLLANFNCIVLDYVTKQKASGGNLNFYVIKQLPIVPLTTYKIAIIEKVIDNVSKLVITSNELVDLSFDLGLNGSIFNWNESERFQLQCELDAIYAHLYGLEKEEMAYILDTFPIVKRKDIAKYGSYRTKDTILQLYDEFAWVREEMKNVEE